MKLMPMAEEPEIASAKPMYLSSTMAVRGRDRRGKGQRPGVLEMDGQRYYTATFNVAARDKGLFVLERL